MNSIRPFAATLLMALYLPVPFYLLALHGFHDVWRRIGLRSYLFLLTFYASLVAAVVALHPAWAWGSGPWPPSVGLLAAVPLVIAIVLATVTYRTIEAGTLHLARQIDPTRGRHLITTGILGRMRHPRYLMFCLLAAANTLFTGYPLVAGSFVLCVLLFHWVIRLEERELLAHFGEDFRRYRETVPAFIPRFRKPDSSQ